MKFIIAVLFMCLLEVSKAEAGCAAVDYAEIKDMDKGELHEYMCKQVAESTKEIEYMMSSYGLERERAADRVEACNQAADKIRRTYIKKFGGDPKCPYKSDSESP